jgi:hypothetical protein
VQFRGRPDDLPPDQLVKLRAYRDELAPLIEAFGEVEVFIRPRTSAPEACPVLSEKVRKKRLKNLGRDTARYGLVNFELRREPLPPISRVVGKLASPPPDPDDEEHVAAGSCVHCDQPCPPSDLAESIPRPDGQWAHFTCELKAEGRT